MPPSSGESIPLSKVLQTRSSSTMDDEERETLLAHGNLVQPARTVGAIWQIVVFTIIGLFIALVSGALAYSLGRSMRNSGVDFVHAPLPDLKNLALLKYFGGMGPWIGAEYIGPPSECKVTQVHTISRHGERYPTGGMGESLSQFANNILNHRFESSLSLLNNWSLAADNWLYSPVDQLDQETLTGPAAGSLRMFTMGTEFRARYGDVWNFRNHDHVRLWASDSKRVIESAKYFALGFFGANTTTSVVIIPETEERWGDSLTTTCGVLWLY